MIKKFLVLNIFLLVLSCTKPAAPNSLELDMDVVIQKTDSINIYYSNSKSIEFTDLQSYWLQIKGSKKNQKISFIFPDSIKPKQIRIDFGRNTAQPEIIINKLKLSYKQKSFVAKGEEVYFLFRVDESNTTINKLTGSLKRKVKTQIVGPSLYPNGDKLYKKLNQLYTEKSQK
jgi:hypothetical protein